jgi:hypothetical protein
MIKNEDTAGRTGSRSAYFRLIQRLGNLLTSNKKEVVDLLNESGIYASYGEDENSLITKFVNNLSNSPKLVLNTSIFLESFNEGSNFDGDNIKKNYYTMRVFLDGNETYSNQDGKGAAILEKFKSTFGEQGNIGSNVPGASTAQGAASGGVAGAVAGAVSDLSKLGTTALQGSQKKKYGAQDLAQKREETRNALIMTAMQNKALKQESDRKKDEQAQKTKRTVIIISSIVGVLMIGLITYAIIKRK